MLWSGSETPERQQDSSKKHTDNMLHVTFGPHKKTMLLSRSETPDKTENRTTLSRYLWNLQKSFLWAARVHAQKKPSSRPPLASLRNRLEFWPWHIFGTEHYNTRPPLESLRNRLEFWPWHIFGTEHYNTRLRAQTQGNNVQTSRRAPPLGGVGGYTYMVSAPPRPTFRYLEEELPRTYIIISIIWL